MNKLNTTVLAILGGIELAFSIAMPILVGGLCIKTFNLEGVSANLFYAVSFSSSLFRGIKLWLK